MHDSSTGDAGSRPVSRTYIDAIDHRVSTYTSTLESRSATEPLHPHPVVHPGDHPGIAELLRATSIDPTRATGAATASAHTDSAGAGKPRLHPANPAKSKSTQRIPPTVPTDSPAIQFAA